MVSVAFVRNDTKDIAVTDIKLTPQAAITSKADLVYSFNWSDTPATSTTEVSSKEKSTASLTFADVTIPSNSENAVVSGTRYYCVPDADNQKQWTVSLKCNGEEKTGTFENSYTWQSGKNYIYVFSLGEKTPKLIEVISQDMKDMYFDCNDIIPGGNFSNTEMTE